MKHLLTILSFILITSCVSTEGIVDPKYNHMVPDDTNVITISTDFTADSLYNLAQKELLRSGHRLDNYDADLKTITTEGKSVGESTFARYTLFIEGNKLTGRVDWRAGQEATAMASAFSGIDVDSSWEPAAWSNGRPKRAFASLIAFMDGIPHSNKKFVKE
ncbi:MAG: hypothetical protein CL666_04610 [Balneola sp.]|nr:hypothetical protein [Balneola sp.]|tara:strand:- start:37330 stop:37812 length:483 start_codon:yes stop_codon:yes gene_type:complete